MPLAALGALGAVGSIGGALIGSHEAGRAADAQTAAANHAADLQSQASKNALDFQKQQYETSQQQEAPWLQAGQSGLNALQYGIGTGGSANGSGVGQGSLTTPYGQQFTAPTDITEQNDPGYMARLRLGTDAIQNSAAARGAVVTGGTARALNQFGQDYASNEYGNVYNRALNTFGTNYNVYNSNQANQYNRLAALSGSGQVQANQLATQGQNASNNVTSNLLGSAANIGQQYNNAGAATASGYVGAGNAWSGALGGISNNLTNLGLLSSLKNGASAGAGGGGGAAPGYWAANGFGAGVSPTALG